LSILAIVLVGAGCAIARPEPTREDVLQKILPSAVQIVVEQREGRRIKSGSGVAIASRRTAEGPSCFVLTSGHTFSGLAGKTEIFAVFGRHTGEGRRARALLVASRDDNVTAWRCCAPKSTGAPRRRPPRRRHSASPSGSSAFRSAATSCSRAAS
jgi:hypothetical protein